jgi:transposase
VPPGQPDPHPQPARRLPAVHPTAGGRPHRPPRERTAAYPARPGAGRQGLFIGANRAYLRRRGIAAVIPVKEDQKKHRRARGRAGGRPPAFDAARYKERNTVERAFNKLKQFRAVATRYDKRDFMYQGTVDVASIRIWLRDPVT